MEPPYRLSESMPMKASLVLTATYIGGAGQKCRVEEGG